ncbi:hypothetical protein D187_004655 [Cystobacter fuscus DSM 2262]|uniref:Peptidase C39-like domain-containing protein n=1 Tax=Cystobacter fuscus (strain ATCC 25194 / DSM 2262 / NBRC 100088 / M29) TaxID=1242864 RepID=S9P3P2_CYSF2|nr:hypothetical protein D187_004655 [Cystobacter fuscus DSM 2262]
MLSGNDPSALSLYGMREGSEKELRDKGMGIVANVNTGHFFTVRRENGKWTSYDSYNHSAPKRYNSFHDLRNAEIGNSPLYVM